MKTINKSYYQIITIFFIGLFSIILNSCGGSGGTTATVYPILLPTVTMLSPTDNAINVSRDPNIQLQFSETMNVATIINANIMLQTIAGVNVPISAIASGDNNQFTFSPTNALTENTQYQVIVTTEVKDTNGNSLAVNKTFSFTTAINNQQQFINSLSRAVSNNMFVLGVLGIGNTISAGNSVSSEGVQVPLFLF